MARTRAALLAAVVRVVARQGARRTTMADIAAEAGVAKATLYNHFRAKEDVLAAASVAEIDRLAETAATAARELPPAAVLARAAASLGDHPALRRLVSDEPAVVASMLALPGPARQRVDRAVGQVLSAVGLPTGAAAVDVVRRWLASQIVDPQQPAAAAATADLLIVALSSAGVAEGTGASASPAETAEPSYDVAAEPAR